MKLNKRQVDFISSRLHHRAGLQMLNTPYATIAMSRQLARERATGAMLPVFFVSELISLLSSDGADGYMILPDQILSNSSRGIPRLPLSGSR